MNLNKTDKIITRTLQILFSILIIVVSVQLINLLSSRTTGNYVIFNDTNEIETDVTVWRIIHKGNTTQIPIKTFTKIGMEYFCTIELMDSTIIVEQIEKYDKLSYEIIRYNVWKEIERHDNMEWTDITLYFKGVKVYDIEPYSKEKLLLYYKDLYLN